MNFVKPMLVVIGSGGTLTTGAYLTKDYWTSSKESKQTSKSIAEVLSGKRLISSLKNTSLINQWQEEFESDKDSIKSLIGFNADDKENGGPALADWCSKQMSLDADKNKEVLKNVEKYCLIRSVSSQLFRKGKTLLEDSNRNGWSATYKKRKDRSANRSDVGLKNGWQDNKETEDLPTIKAWCLANSQEDFTSSSSDSLYTKVLKWCTVNGANED